MVASSLAATTSSGLPFSNLSRSAAGAGIGADATDFSGDPSRGFFSAPGRVDKSSTSEAGLVVDLDFEVDPSVDGSDNEDGCSCVSVILFVDFICLRPSLRLRSVVRSG